MKIASVQAFLLSYPFEQPIDLRYYGGQRQIFKRDALFVRIETDEGLIGYAPGEATEHARQTIEDVVGPFLQGRTLGDPDALRVLFLNGPGADDSVAKVYCSVEIGL